MGDYSGVGPVDPYEAERLAAEEEERKRREEEARLAALANPGAGIELPAGLQPSGAETFPVSEGGPVKPPEDTVEQKHEVVTYADGSQTRKTTQEVPAKAAPTFGEQVGNYLNNRINTAVQGVTDRVNNIQTAVADPQAALQQRLAAGPGGAISNQDRRANQQPGSGDETFDRQIQAESGGNHIDPKTGQIITSPKGALGIAQIMPKSAMQPGFGIKDIFSLAQERGIPFNDRSEASAKQLLANKDLNLEMGKNYRTGMLNYFGGDNEKATASYNAGAGRVNQAVKQAEANGGDWKDYLPTETKNYLQKTIGPVQPVRGQPAQSTAVAPPGFQGQTDEFGGMEEPRMAPPTAVTPVTPEAVDTSPIPTQGGIGIRAPGQPTGVTSSASAIDRYQAAQDDPMELMKMRNDDSIPQIFRTRAGNRAADILQEGKLKSQAEQTGKAIVDSGDSKPVVKVLSTTPKTPEGSYLKAYLLNRFGFEKAANEELARAGGYGGKSIVETDEDGNKVQVDYNSQGKVIGGLKADGTELNATQAIAFASGGTKIAKPDVSMQDVEATIDGKVVKGRVVTTYDRNNKPTTQVESGGKKYEYDGRWKATSIGAAAEKAETASAIKLRYAGPTSYTEAGAKAAGEFNFQNGTNIGYQSQQPGAPLVDLNTGKPVQVGAGGVITTTQSGTPGMAPAQVGATTTTPAVTGQTPAQITSESGVNKVAREQFVKTTVPAVIEQGNNGRDIATARRQQLSIIENNPSILDIYNGSGTQYDRGRNVISKLLTGVYNENNSGDFYKDVQATGLDSNQRSAIEQMWNLTQGINGKTLKTNTGGGPVSNADMRTNQAANLQNFTETTPLGALQVINRSKFQGDLDAAKTAFIAANPQFNDDVKFNSAWAKESAKYTKAYEGIAEERANFLKPFAPPKNATKEQLSAFRDKVFKSFEMYPVPTFDPAGAPGKQWSYGTANAERAAAKKLLGRK